MYSFASMSYTTIYISYDIFMTTQVALKNNYISLKTFVLLIKILHISVYKENLCFTNILLYMQVLTAICISLLHTLRSCSLLTYIRLRAYRPPEALTKNTIANPPVR